MLHIAYRKDKMIGPCNPCCTLCMHAAKQAEHDAARWLSRGSNPARAFYVDNERSLLQSDAVVVLRNKICQ